MSRRSFPIILVFLAFFLLCAALPGPLSAIAAETHSEFNLKEEKVERGNLLNLIFGTAPPLATERGILLIDAYFDRNGNEQRDSGEESLDREVFCLVDDIEYDVPAFIPGLAFQGSYKILCAGERYQPLITKKELFVDRRGQILRIDLPCRLAPPGKERGFILP